MAVAKPTTPRRKKAVPTPTPHKTPPTKPVSSKRGQDILNSARELARQDRRRRGTFNKNYK